MCNVFLCSVHLAHLFLQGITCKIVCKISLRQFLPFQDLLLLCGLLKVSKLLLKEEQTAPKRYLVGFPARTEQDNKIAKRSLGNLSMYWGGCIPVIRFDIVFKLFPKK